MTQNLLESHEATNPSPQTTKNVDYESAQQKQNYRQSKWRSLKDTWWLELTACIFSLACFVAIAAVLLFAHNRPLSSWHLDVSPNTVVSFIATVATSSFLFALSEVVSQLKWLHFQNSAHPLLELEHFDSASRGPLGSLNLVRRHHVRTKLASWAAVVVILSLLVSPFVQLIITFPTPTLPSGSGVNSTFGVASLYDPTSTVIDGHDTQMSGTLTHNLNSGSNLTLPPSGCHRHPHESSSDLRLLQRSGNASHELPEWQLHLHQHNNHGRLRWLHGHHCKHHFQVRA